MLGCLLSCGLVPAINCIEIPPLGPACTTQFVYGLSATVVDDETGDPIDDAVLTLRDGNYVEVMELLPTGSYAGAGERPGTYDLTVEIPDGPTQTFHQIEIDADECHVIGLAVEIRVAGDDIIVLPSNFACTEEARPGVIVKVINAVTGVPITDAIVTLTEGDYHEELEGGDGDEYVGAFERRGIYSLVVEAPGFLPETIDTVVVTENFCHVNTTKLTVALRRSMQ
ncbi:MAG TPA: carboxypeptidase regulatory-like domain-containing protein [Phycisphaerae bacterium]|nr:carboxypeptidase regulatory-like domain-containing protein [Phycisphaerae bacterium]